MSSFTAYICRSHNMPFCKIYILSAILMSRLRFQQGRLPVRLVRFQLDHFLELAKIIMLVTPIIDHATMLGAEGAKILPVANARYCFNLTTDILLATALPIRSLMNISNHNMTIYI